MGRFQVVFFRVDLIIVDIGLLHDRGVFREAHDDLVWGEMKGASVRGERQEEKEQEVARRGVPGDEGKLTHFFPVLARGDRHTLG